MATAIDKLRATAGKKGDKKAEIPSYEITDPKLARNIQRIGKIKRLAKTLETLQAQAESSLVDTAERLRLDYCRQKGEVQPSVKLAAKGSSVTYVRSKAFVKMTGEAIDSLKTIILSFFMKEKMEPTPEKVDEQYNSYFEENETLSIKCSDLTEREMDAVAKALLKVLPEKRFGELVTLEKVVKPKDTYVHDVLFDEKTARLASMFTEEGLVTPTKPCFK